MTSTLPELTKVTANFTPRAMDALNEASERERASRTDVLNRSVQVYNVIMHLTQGGGRVLVQLPSGETRELVIT